MNWLKMAVFALVLFITSSTFGSITTATANGDWVEGGIWDNGVPGCFDTIVIPAGIQVEITSTIDLEGCADSILIMVSGTLKFQSGKKLKLPCDSDVFIFVGGSLEGGGGGGNSNNIEICNTVYWQAGDGDVSGPSSFCDGGCPTLPIELVYFTATLGVDRKVYLDWKTASEVDNDYFNVERSFDGVVWENVLQKDAVGNSSIPVDYDDVDVDPLLGQSYYRLKQTDYDLSYSYSPAVRINHFDSDEILLYPNPVLAGNQVVVNFPKGLNADAEISICSVDGKKVYVNTFEIKNSHQAILNLSPSISAGVYLIQCNYFSKKLVIQ